MSITYVVLCTLCVCTVYNMQRVSKHENIYTVLYFLERGCWKFKKYFYNYCNFQLLSKFFHILFVVSVSISKIFFSLKILPNWLQLQCLDLCLSLNLRLSVVTGLCCFVGAVDFTDRESAYCSRCIWTYKKNIFFYFISPDKVVKCTQTIPFA